MINFSLPGRPFFHQPWLIGLATIDFLILDQLSKYVVRYWLDVPIVLVPDWFKLVFVENTGVAFSLPVPGDISIILAVLVSLWLGYAFCMQQLSTTMRWAYVLIAAGAIGNLIDRLWYGAVTDFLAVGTFPVFNFADSFITIGVVLFIWQEVTSG